MDTFKKFKLNELNSSILSYKETTLPTQEMKDWFNYEFNQKPENMDNLEYDMWLSNQEKEFFDEFRYELMYLTYLQKLDAFTKSMES